MSRRESVREALIRKTFLLRRKVASLEYSLMAALAVVLVFVPIVRPESRYLFHVLITAFVFAMLAASWDVAMGYTGQLSVAHIVFFAAGGYTWALLDIAGLNSWLALLIAIMVSLVMGVAIGYLCLRFRGPYILVVTLALIEILRITILAFRETTGGSRGLTGFGRFPGIDSLVADYYLGLGLLAIVTLGLGLMGRSMFGKRFRAIRENPTKAEMIGIDTVRYKVVAFVVSAGVAGLAGAFFAQYIRVLTPNVFEIVYLVYPIAMAVVGGVGTIFGPVVGSLIFVSAAESLRGAGAFWENIFLGVVLILVMLYRPLGIWNLATDAFEARTRRRIFGENSVTDEDDAFEDDQESEQKGAE